MIGISPSLSREITKSLISAAEKNNISYQREVMSGLTSTNADEFAVSGAGVKTCTVSVPIRYMHTPCEVVSLDDIRLTGEVLAAWLKEI
jgi:endoglucanase